MDIISGEDDRVLVVVGPCSIHDAEQGLAVRYIYTFPAHIHNMNWPSSDIRIGSQYGKKLKEHFAEFPNLVLLMRCYFEKPRTTYVSATVQMIYLDKAQFTVMQGWLERSDQRPGPHPKRLQHQQRSQNRSKASS